MQDCQVTHIDLLQALKDPRGVCNLAEIYNAATMHFDLKRLMHNILAHAPSIEKIECTWWNAPLDLTILPIVCERCYCLSNVPPREVLDRLQGAPWSSVKRLLLRHRETQASPRAEHIESFGAWLDATSHWDCNCGYCYKHGPDTCPCVARTQKAWPAELQPAFKQVTAYSEPKYRDITASVDNIGKNLHTLILTVSLVCIQDLGHGPAFASMMKLTIVI